MPKAKELNEIDLNEVFDKQKETNVEVLQTFLKTEKHKQLKFSNPLRTYSHLLTGRLITALIKLESMIFDLEKFGNLQAKMKKQKKKKKGKKGKKGAEEENPEEDQAEDDEKFVFPSKKDIVKLKEVFSHIEKLIKDQFLY